MMKPSAVLEAFHNRYSGIGFERGGLFRLLREEFRPDEALYPGCSIHLTPACFFPQTVFVDRDPAAERFFSQRADILEFVRRHRVYRRTPDIRFFHQDFTDPLPVRKDEFDLLISLFTVGVAKACQSHLKSGGLLLTDNYRQSAAGILRTGVFEPVAAVVFRKGKYVFTGMDEAGERKPAAEPEKQKRYLFRQAGGITFRDEETYFLYRKASRRR
jgi:hypothetical protein